MHCKSPLTQGKVHKFPKWVVKATRSQWVEQRGTNLVSLHGYYYCPISMSLGWTTSSKVR